MQLSVTVPNLDQTEDLLRAFRELYPDRQVFAFYGDLGAGKTTLIKELCRDLGVDDEEMSSPSFSLVNEYTAGEGKVFHLDLYRLEDPKELADIGWFDYLDQNQPIFVEWPEHAGDLLPEDTVNVKIKVAEHSNERTLTLTYEP